MANDSCWCLGTVDFFEGPVVGVRDIGVVSGGEEGREEKYDVVKGAEERRMGG